MTTEEKIIDKALELFNERGIEYVGLRELAAVLGIRVGNITYYFPTKDDLVNRLALDLAALNSQELVESDGLTLHSFLDHYANVFNNQVQYRCLLVSFVHLIEQNKVMSERYKQTEQQRRNTILSNVVFLKTAGYLEPTTDADFLVSAFTLIARFWISEATVSFRQLHPHDQIRHYLGLLAKLLLPYAAPKGQADIERFLNNIGKLAKTAS